jgi:hypothetical protein
MIRNLKLRMLDIPTIEKRNVGRYQFTNIEEQEKEQENKAEADKVIKRLIGDAKDKEALIRVLKAKLKNSKIEKDTILIHRLDIASVKPLEEKIREVWSKKEKQQQEPKQEQEQQPQEQEKKCELSIMMQNYHDAFKDNDAVIEWFIKSFPLSFDREKGEFRLHEDEKTIVEKTVKTLKQRGM